MREIKTCPYQDFPQMSTEELDNILQAELEKENPNEEVVLPILKELEEREKNLPVEKTPEVLEIYEKLSKYETSSKQSIHKRRWVAAAAAIAATVCIVVLSSAPQVRADGFWDTLFRWTSSIFEFFTPEQDASNPPVDIVFETDNPGLQQLYDKVVEHGVTESVVPTWLPEGFVLSELKNVPVLGGSKLYGTFDNDSKGISFTYRMSTDISSNFEKKDSSVEVYDYADTSHFILENVDKVSVTWIVDGVECSIVTDIPKDDVYKIIRSIYRRSL